LGPHGSLILTVYVSFVLREEYIIQSTELVSSASRFISGILTKPGPDLT